jgi:hypothetical protein
MSQTRDTWSWVANFDQQASKPRWAKWPRFSKWKKESWYDARNYRQLMTFPRFLKLRWPFTLGPQLQPDATAASLWPSAVPASASLGDCRRWSQPNDPIGWSSSAHGIFPRAKLDDMDIYIYMVTLCKMDRTSVLWRGNTGFRNRFSLIYYPLVI